jgi:four helix bundle protein
MAHARVVRYQEHTAVNAYWSMALSKPARTFQYLLVWRKAHQFVLGVYALTAAFPKQETYGLSLQMRRASVSIPANIAEGFRRRGKPEKARFMNIAEGSVLECPYFLILVKDLGYGDTERLAVSSGQDLNESVKFRDHSRFLLGVLCAFASWREVFDRPRQPRLVGLRSKTSLASLLEEVSRLLHAYTAAILTPGSLDSHIRRISRRSLG